MPDIVEKRGPFRAAHLDGANKKAEAGKLVMAGALADPVDGAVFVFRNCSKEEIEAFVQVQAWAQGSWGCREGGLRASQ